LLLENDTPQPQFQRIGDEDWEDVDDFLEFRQLIRNAPRRIALGGVEVIDLRWVYPSIESTTWVPLEEILEMDFSPSEVRENGKAAPSRAA
jgi:hypothetical protein